jgi:hypothetical protein
MWHCWLDRDGHRFECQSTENGPPLLMVVASEDESTLNPLSHEGRLPSELAHSSPLVTKSERFWTAFRARN